MGDRKQQEGIERRDKELKGTLRTEEREEKGSFIRYATDSSLNEQQKKELRWDDPARLFVQSLKPKKNKFRPPENRFNIMPGEHWDGIDRSNGFERRYLQSLSLKEARKDEEHRQYMENI